MELINKKFHNVYDNMLYVDNKLKNSEDEINMLKN